MRFDYIFVADYKAAAYYFIRLMKELDGNSLLVTNLLSVYLYARFKRVNCKLLVAYRGAGSDQVNIDIMKTREYVSSQLTPMQIDSYASSVLRILNSIDVMSGKTKVICWNGCDVVGAVVRLFCRERDIVNLFMEISNIPGKLVVDKDGVNSWSKICDEDFVIPEPDVKYDAALEYFSEIISLKKEYVPPQSVAARNISLGMLLDSLFMLSFGCGNYNFNSVVRKLESKIKSRRPFFLSKTDFDAEYFFPMQVGDDSQMLLNSDYNLTTAIEYVLANYPGRVAIKPHPAEMDPKINSLIDGFVKSGVVDLYTGPVDYAISSCKCVLTVNSTVGFEALLYGKEVVFIGRSQYSKLDNYKKLYWYLNEYLVSGDFFDENYPVDAVVKSIEC
jgi:capsular polysaccharide export protein